MIDLGMKALLVAALWTAAALLWIVLATGITIALDALANFLCSCIRLLFGGARR